MDARQPGAMLVRTRLTEATRRELQERGVLYVDAGDVDYCATCGTYETMWDDGGLWCWECSKYLVERGMRRA